MDSFAAICGSSLGLALSIDLIAPNLQRCPDADTLFAELAQPYGPTDAAICVELVEYVRAVAPAIFSEAESHLNYLDPGVIYQPAHFRSDLAVHLDLLVGLVPPIEYKGETGTNPTTLATILNVGWAVLLSRLDHMPNAGANSLDVSVVKMERLHELLLKAVELAEARKIWEEHQR